MIQVIGQATQSNGGSPSWTLTGICKSAARTGTGTYTVTIDYLGALGIDNKDKLTILISAERGNLGTERYVVDWTSENTFRIRNYTARNNQTLGDCILTITILADVNPLRLGLNGNTLVLAKCKFFDVTSDGGYIEASNTAGYPGELNSLTGVPASNVYKCSGFNITGASLTGNEFKYCNSNVSAEALFEHSRNLTLENGDHGVLSADKMSGFSGDVVTVDATTDEGWYLSAIALTGAEATGTKFMFIGNNVTALGKYTDVGFPVTYETTEGGSCTGDVQIFIPGSEGITLQTAYDTYYRFSGYDITGGSIVDGKLVPTGPCTAKAVYKVNYFTATGEWEKGSNVNAVALGNKYEGDALVPEKYAIHGNHTGDIPVSWYETSSRWNINSLVSAYQITLEPVMQFQARYTGRTGSKGWTTACCLLGTTATLTETYYQTNNWDWTYSQSFTSNVTGINYGISARVHAWARDYGNGNYMTASYIATGTTGTWTATGIAP